MEIDVQDVTILPPGHTRPNRAEDEVIRIHPVGEPSPPGRSDQQHVGGAPATPPELLLGALPHPRLRLRAPLHLRVEQEGDFIAVWNPDLEEFGYGRHLTEAIEDLQQTIVELYATLQRDEARQGPAMRALWGRLQLLVEPRP